MMKLCNKNYIYLDHHATTPVDERVFNKMKAFFLSEYGNPSSKSHGFGWRAQDAVDEARVLVARAINAHPTEIIFTSGATESTNMALKGLCLPGSGRPLRQVVTSTIEHSATLAVAHALRAHGVGVHTLAPTREGIITPEQLHEVIESESLVSLFFAHNEIGSINPIEKIARVAKAAGHVVHCDAAQAVGRTVVDCQKLGVDLMSFSGHKVYGPKGVGCLYVRKELIESIMPLIHGGGQEWHKRSGTLNVPGIVGMGEAFRLATLDFAQENQRIEQLRDRLWSNLKVLDGVFLNGSLKNRVSGNLNVSFADIDGEELVLAICDRVAISTGSACSSAFGASRVLEALGVPAELRQASIRFGLGRCTTALEIDEASELIVQHVKRLRSASMPRLVKISRST